MERRKFLNAGILTLGAITIPGVVKSEESKLADQNGVGILNTGKSFFGSESGILGKDEVYVLGVLGVSNSNTSEKKLKAIRENINFRTELSFVSCNKHKLPFVKEGLRLYFNSNMMFAAKIIRKEDYLNKVNGKVSRGSKRSFKVNVYRELLKEIGYTHNKSKLFKPSVFVKKQSSPFSSPNFKKRMKKGLGLKYKTIDAYDSNLLQLTDLLTGCVRSDKNSLVTNRTKRDSISMLKQQLNVSHLESGVNTKDKFIII